MARKKEEKKACPTPNLSRSLAKLIMRSAKGGKLDLKPDEIKELVLLLALETGNDDDNTIVQRGKLRLEALKTLAQMSSDEGKSEADAALLDILSKK